jgi:carbon storage regulator
VLVFTRKIDEAIIIGDGVEVKILRVGRDGVRIGVTAPAQVPVHREEVYTVIREANARAAADPSAIEAVAERLRRTSADLVIKPS